VSAGYPLRSQSNNVEARVLFGLLPLS
jgi:hypothetical protein